MPIQYASGEAEYGLALSAIRKLYHGTRQYYEITDFIKTAMASLMAFPCS